MKAKLKAFWTWAVARPTVLVNIVGLAIIIFGAATYIIYNSVRPIDVLVDWTVKTTKQPVDGSMPRYNPGGTLEYISSSNKLVPAQGTLVRTFKCDAIPGMAGPRDIRLPASPVSRSPGVSDPTEVSVLVPAIIEFNGLPRTCFLRIEVCYPNVVLWRTHCEVADSNKFIVEEASLNQGEIRKQIDDLNKRIEELEAQLIDQNTSNTTTVTPQSQQRTATNNTTNNTTTNNTTNNNVATDVPEDKPSALSRIPIIGPILGGLGL